MKKQLQGFIFWTIALAFIIIMFGLAELLVNLINMNFIMTVAYISLGFSFIYVLKNI